MISHDLHHALISLLVDAPRKEVTLTLDPATAQVVITVAHIDVLDLDELLELQAESEGDEAPGAGGSGPLG